MSQYNGRARRLKFLLFLLFIQDKHSLFHKKKQKTNSKNIHKCMNVYIYNKHSNNSIEETRTFYLTKEKCFEATKEKRSQGVKKN